VFHNCDNKPSSYIALFKEKQHRHYYRKSHPQFCTDVLHALKQNDGSMNKKYFMETSWGGCDCYIRKDGKYKRYKKKKKPKKPKKGAKKKKKPKKPKKGAIMLTAIGIR